MLAKKILGVLISFIVAHLGTLVMCACSFWKLLVLMQTVEATPFTEIASSVGVGVGVWLSIGTYGRAASNVNEPQSSRDTSKMSKPRRGGYVKRL